MEYLIIKTEADRVTAARFEVSGRSISLGGAASFTRDAENTLPVIASNIADGIKGSPKVILCLEPSLFAQRLVEIPLKDIRKAREVLPALLHGEIVLPPEEVVFDLIPAAGGRFMAVWVRKTEIAQAIGQFKSVGIDPRIVTSDPFSWHLLPGIAPDSAISDGTALMVVADGRPAFMGTLEAGSGAAQISAMLSALELSGATPPAKMTFFGENAPALASSDSPALPADVLELPTELAAVFRTDAAFQHLAPLYAVSVAGNAGTLPDFRRGDLVWTADDAGLRKKMFLTALLSVLVVVALLVSKGLQYRAARADITSLNKSISSIYREIFPSRTKAVDELAEIKGEIRKLANAEEAHGVLDVLKVLAEAKGTNVIGLYEVELDGRTLRIKGAARSSSAVGEFKAALSPLMSSVEPGEVKGRPDGTVSFSLSGLIREVAK